MRIFLDANILITVLNKEYPLYYQAARVLSLSEHGRFKLYTSPICLAIAFYFASKKSGERKAKEKIALLTSKINITTVDEETCKAAASNPRVNDYEDGMQYYSALAKKCEVIVTTDVDDFYFSEVAVNTCESFIKNYF